MKTTMRLMVCAGLALFALGCSKGGAEGKYVLDKAAMKAEFQKQVDKLPEDQKGMAQLAVAMMDAINMEVELQKEGKLTLTSSKPSFKKDAAPKVETKDGTWKMEEKKLILTVPGEKELKCDHEGNSFKCVADKDMSLVFVKA